MSVQVAASCFCSRLISCKVAGFGKQVPVEERSSTTGLRFVLTEAGGSGNQGRHAKGGMRANPAWPGLAKDTFA